MFVIEEPMSRMSSPPASWTTFSGARQRRTAKAHYGIDATETGEEAARIVAERAGRFVDEIRGSVDYYTAQADSVPLRRLVVTGGAGKLPGLAERLADQLRLELVEAQPMRDVQVGDLNVEREDLVDAQPFLAVAIGLALGAAE